MDKQRLMQLVTRAQDGDVEAHSELFTSYRDIVYSIALRETKSRTLAEDIVQETFLEVIQTIHQLREPAAFPTWLKTITYHQCTRYYKRKETLHEVTVDETEASAILDTLEEQNTAFLPDASLDQKEFKATILQMLDTLPEVQSSALRMFYFEGLSLKDIASAQEVSVNTANTRLNRGRIAMKYTVEDYEKKHGIRLHTIAFLPLFRWLLANMEQEMPAASAERVSHSIASKTGVSLVSLDTAVTGTAEAAATPASSAAVAAGTGAKLMGLPIATRIAAVVATVGIVVGTPVVVYNYESPNQVEAQIVQQSEVASEVQDTTALLELDSHMLYEEILKAGSTESGLSVRYFAFLDLEQDGTEELIAANNDGTPGSDTTCEIYTCRDGKAAFVGTVYAHYDYLYHVNGRYLLGMSRMGYQYVSTSECLNFAIYHWNEDMTCNDPAISRNGGPWEYITQENFDYYNSLPNQRSGNTFIETTSKVILEQNPFLTENLLQETLDFSKGWDITQPDVTESIPVYAFSFQGDHTFTYFYGYKWSDIVTGNIGTYSIEGHFITFSLNTPDRIMVMTYDFDPDSLQLTQISEEGFFQNSVVGSVYQFEEDEYNDAKRVKELAELFF